MYNHVAVGVYSNQRDVAATIQTLEEMSIPMTRISIGRCDGQPLDAFLKHYATPERGDMSPETWIVELPGLDPFVVLGPLARLCGSVMFRDVSGDISGQVTFVDIAADYRHWLIEAGHSLVIVHCNAAEVSDVVKVLKTCQAQNPKSYEFAGAEAAYSTLT